MKQHKWHKEIKAWADGAEIEKYISGAWVTISNPIWDEDEEYRIKPQPKQPQYLYVYMEPETGNYKFTNKIANLYKPFYIGKIKLEEED